MVLRAVTLVKPSLGDPKGKGLGEGSLFGGDLRKPTWGGKERCFGDCWLPGASRSLGGVEGTHCTMPTGQGGRGFAHHVLALLVALCSQGVRQPLRIPRAGAEAGAKENDFIVPQKPVCEPVVCDRCGLPITGHTVYDSGSRLAFRRAWPVPPELGQGQ